MSRVWTHGDFTIAKISDFFYFRKGNGIQNVFRSDVILALLYIFDYPSEWYACGWNYIPDVNNTKRSFVLNKSIIDSDKFVFSVESKTYMAFDSTDDMTHDEALGLLKFLVS